MTAQHEEGHLHSDESTTMHWSDDMLIGHGSMDEMHHEFVALVNDLQRCTLETVEQCLTRLSAHLAEHFSSEEELMVRIGYPEMACHAEEHSAVVESVNGSVLAYRGGMFGLYEVRQLAQALMRWLPGHIAYMDSALSTWFSKKTYGGVPVVIKRSNRLPETANCDAKPARF